MIIKIKKILKKHQDEIVILNQYRHLILLNEIISHGHLIHDLNPPFQENFEQRILHSAIDFKHQRKMTMGV